MKFVITLFLAFSTVAFSQLGPCTIETVAGGLPKANGNGGLATSASLLRPGVARMGPDGALYFSDISQRQIRRVMPDGNIEAFAGNGSADYSGDAGPAIGAGIPSPRELAFAPDGSLYFLDSAPDSRGRPHSVLRRISPAGTIEAIAGRPRRAYSGDGGPAADAGLGNARRFAVGPDGSVYLSGILRGGHRIRRISPSGDIDTIAGVGDPNANRGSVSGDGGPAVEASLSAPSEIAVDSNGVIYFVDEGRRVRRILTDGTIESFIPGLGRMDADGTSRTELFLGSPQDIEIDDEGRLYWLMTNTIRRIGHDDLVETIWSSTTGDNFGRFSVGGGGEIFASGALNIFELSNASSKEAVVGTGSHFGFGDGGPALEATIFPTSIALGNTGEIFIAENSLRRVRVVKNGRIEPFAGTGERASTGDGGPATEASFFQVNDVAVGPDGSVFVADNDRVRRIDPQGMIGPYAGDGSPRCDSQRPPLPQCGNGGLAVDAPVPDISQILVDQEGVLYILNFDRGRERAIQSVRVVTSDGLINSLLGQHNSLGVNRIGLDGDDVVISGGQIGETLFRFGRPDRPPSFASSRGFFFGLTSIAGDGTGNVYVSRPFNGLLRLNSNELLQTLVDHEVGLPGPRGDGGPATDASTGRAPHSLRLDSRQDLYFVDDQRVRRINQPGDCPEDRTPMIAGIANGSFINELAPGTVMSIFGLRLGPDEALGAIVEANGRLTSTLGGVEVLVDGVRAPLIFASESQVNAVVPYETDVTGRLFGFEGNQVFASERAARFEVAFNGSKSTPFSPRVRETAPSLFLIDNGRAAALNQDGTLNSPQNPAEPGSVIVLFGTGEGRTNPAGVDGLIATEVLPRPLANVKIYFGNEDAAIAYFGAAPGLVAGVFQANAFISPDQHERGSVRVLVEVGDSSNRSQVGTISIAR